MKTTLAFGAQMIGFKVEPTSAWTSSVANASAPCASFVTSATSALGTTHSRTALDRGLPVAPLPQPAKCSAPYSPALPVSLPISPLCVSTASTAYAAPVFNGAVLPPCASTNIDFDALEAQLSIFGPGHTAARFGLKWAGRCSFHRLCSKILQPQREARRSQKPLERRLFFSRAAAAAAEALSQYERECEVVQFRLTFSLEREVSRNM